MTAFSLMAISNFFDDFLKVFSDYNFIDKYIYSPEMDFSKLKPYILDTKSPEEREDSWLGIIFSHNQRRRGDIYYQTSKVTGEFDIETQKKEVYLCSQVSLDLSFNIVSNNIYLLQALENEITYFYDGLRGYPNPLPKLPELTGFISNITLGEFTKYNSKTYGELCSLGMSGVLNYPILLKGYTIGIIKQINLTIGNKIKGLEDDSIFYQSQIRKD